MQPFNTKGKNIRFALMPLSFVIAGLTIYAILFSLSQINGSSIIQLIKTDSLMPLLIFLPGFFFGKVLGLMICNCLAYIILPLRRIFNEEVKETGRHSFSKAMKDLSVALAVTGGITLICSIIFLKLQ